MGGGARRVISRAAARRVRLVGLDVDGVMTDGGIYLGDVAGARLEMKRYDIQDGLGVYFLRRAGIKVALITGRESESVALRGRELGVDAVEQDSRARKLPALKRVLRRFGISADEVAFVGDDLPDLGIFRTVGLPVAVGNATIEIRRLAKVQLTAHGGRGAVREFAELLLRARGEWNALVEEYVTERSRDEPDATVARVQVVP
jgi:3-deoxy-D-manno-octulosonate 8-phosphate phosphatase (KDO 8-P phosphatase)